MFPYLIGITGASGSGKTTLARALGERLGAPASVVSLDWYYRDLADLTPAAREQCNFDAPAALDRDLLAGQLAQLAAGEPVVRPVYRYENHARSPRGEPLAPTPFLIVEGLFTLYWPEVRERLRTRVFLDAPDELCLARRLARDTAERGRTAEEVRRRYERTVRPMYAAHVAPTRAWAHVVLSAAENLETWLARTLDHVRANLV